MFILRYALHPKQRQDYLDQPGDLVETQSIPGYTFTIFTRFEKKVDDPDAPHLESPGGLENAAKDKVEAEGELKFFTNHVHVFVFVATRVSARTVDLR